MDKFSTHLKNVLKRALVFAVEKRQSHVRPEHLLWALVTEKGCVGAEILHKASVRPENIETFVGTKSGRCRTPPDLSFEAKRAIEKAVLTANMYGHRYVGTEHLLCGLLQAAHAPLKRFFTQSHIDTRAMRGQIAVMLKNTTRFPELADAMAEADSMPGFPAMRGSEVDVFAPPELEDDFPTNPNSKTPALDYFGRDLTSHEVQKDIDPVIGREREIQRVMEILCRRTKNNPLLLGEPGVGKTAIVEGLSKRILEKRVPPALLGKRIVALDLALVVAGTMYRGEFEGRLRQIMDEVKDHPHILLFIDEVHMIVGAGATSGTMDAANILKPALAKGSLRCIGATTLEEHKKHIEADSALCRRFQTVLVEEPTPERALEILEGVASNYETFHGVTISPEARESAVHLSVRYLQDKRLPDKAIDLLDEAASGVRVRAEIPGPADQKHLLLRLIEETRERKRAAVVEERFNEALAHKKEEEALLRQLETGVFEQAVEARPVIGMREVARVVAHLAGVPEADVLREAGSQFTLLEHALAQRVVGQERAVADVASAIRRAKAGIAHPNRPLASLLFAGPSGVGKTEMARAIAATIFGDEKQLIRLDMSEYAESFTASKLVGAPAGYVGYREGARLTDRVKQKSHCVILFDELEKAHPDVQNLLLQVLEEGEIADAAGKTVSFRHAIILITTNVGRDRFEQGRIGFHADQDAGMREDIKQELLERFRPELINRLDHWSLFSPLSHEALSTIAQKHISELAERLLHERGAHLEAKEHVCAHIAHRVDNKLGARDIRRIVQMEIESPIAESLLKGGESKRFLVTLKKDKLSVRTTRD